MASIKEDSEAEGLLPASRKPLRLTGSNAVLFITAVAVGCSVTALVKGVYAVGGLPDGRSFKRPLSVELLLFTGMLLGLPTEAVLKRGQLSAPWRQVLWLAVPALCDICATTCLNLGLLSLSMSMVQLLRSSMTLFAALLRWGLAGHRPTTRMWAGMAINAGALGLVGYAASHTTANGATGSAPLGVVFILASAAFQALQFVLEECVLSGGMSPLCVMGVEGAWGVLLMVAVVFPVARALKGHDEGGSYENALTSWHLLLHSRLLAGLVVALLVALYVFNVQQMLVNARMGAVYNSLIATVRPFGVWAVDLALYSASHGAVGDAWNTPWSYMQLAGLVVVTLGTLVFNGNVCCRDPGDPDGSAPVDEVGPPP